VSVAEKQRMAPFRWLRSPAPLFAAATLLAGSLVTLVAKQVTAPVPLFDPAHPSAAPAPRSNSELGGRAVVSVPPVWRLEDGWPAAVPSGISSARAGLAAGEQYGQVTGVEIDAQGRVWVLHRTPERQWDGAAFDSSHVIRHATPIQGSCIVRYPSEDATTIDLQAGSQMFQMPHAIKVDHEGFVWVVDCGLHQVLKFAADDLVRPVLSLGVALQPGSDTAHLCKPTDVLILPDGTFYVSDGYCNARIIHYSKDGTILRSWGTAGRGPGQFQLPHALAWDEPSRTVFVADRQNRRVQVTPVSRGPRSAHERPYTLLGVQPGPVACVRAGGTWISQAAQAFTAEGEFVREYQGAGQGWGFVFGVAVKILGGKSDPAGPFLFLTTVGPSQVTVRIAALCASKRIHHLCGLGYTSARGNFR
jgi:hypothetical protein